MNILKENIDNLKATVQAKFAGITLLAHHIIPFNILRNSTETSILGKAVMDGFNLNDALNGSWIPQNLHIPTYYGHTQYDNYVKRLISPTAFQIFKNTHPSATEYDFIKDNVIPNLNIFIKHCLDNGKSLDSYAKELL